MKAREGIDSILRDGLIRLLEIKDSDIRILTLEQGYAAVDHGIHIGGAFSAVIPMVSLYYSGVMRIDVEQPTRVGQDLFILSKGHAVASMASIYADLGYFSRGVLLNSRSVESILNGHPGPILPGILISTGPEGHGMPVAQGLAIAGKRAPKFDVYTLAGDGELQAGMIWEAIMFAAAKRLDNLCVLVDKNEGQLDNPRQLQFPMPNVKQMFEAFGWRVLQVNGMEYGPVLGALETFKFEKRDGRPTAVICNTLKGFGAFSGAMVSHKMELTEALTAQELELQRNRRLERVSRLFDWLDEVEGQADAQHIKEQLLRFAGCMNLEVLHAAREIRTVEVGVRTRRAVPRDKRVFYEESLLPRPVRNKPAMASAVVAEAMKVFARGGRVVSIDADLGTTSGLEAGVGYVDQSRALNVGVAESNMSCIGESFALLGYNTWVSTFCPFFDWRVLRRIGVGYQERKEAIVSGQWLSEGHNLDLTFLATAANFDTRTNGATHMGNDDILVFGQVAHLKIIDVSCPNQLLGVMKWIMEGNKGLVYLRIMRAASNVVYGDDFRFQYGRGYWLCGDWTSSVFIVSSGRQVHESLAAARSLEEDGLKVAVVDMPAIDDKLLVRLHDSGKTVLLAEQNNGFIWDGFRKALFQRGSRIDADRVIPINTLDGEGNPQYIHSATYEQLLERFRLSPEHLIDRVKRECRSDRNG